jgi:chromosomal replication initiator protein
MDIYTYWSQTLEMFKKTFDDQVIFDSIFTLLKAREIRDNELIVTIDSIFNIGYVDDYVDQLQDIYNSIAGTNIKLVIMSDND